MLVDFLRNYGELVDARCTVEEIFLNEVNYKYADPSTGQFILSREQIANYLNQYYGND